MYPFASLPFHMNLLRASLSSALIISYVSPIMQWYPWLGNLFPQSALLLFRLCTERSTPSALQKLHHGLILCSAPLVGSILALYGVASTTSRSIPFCGQRRVFLSVMTLVYLTAPQVLVLFFVMTLVYPLAPWIFSSATPQIWVLVFDFSLVYFLTLGSLLSVPWRTGVR